MEGYTFMFNASNFRPRKDVIPTLNGLRGIAVLLVLFSHLPQESKVLEAINYIFQPGYLGIDLFFVLSGFLITRILLFERINENPLRNFFIRRFLRIFPIYYLTLFLILVFAPEESLAWCFFYISNFYFAFYNLGSPLEHTWSLAVEEQFYLIWPLLIFFIALQKVRNLILYVILPSIVIMAVIATYYGAMSDYRADRILFRFTIFRVLSLGAGALIAFYEPQIRSYADGVKKVLIVCILTALLILPLATFVDDPWVQLIKLIGFCAFSVFVVISCILANEFYPYIKQMLCLKPLIYFGKISYGLYLYHLPIFYFLGLYGGYRPENPPSLLVIATALALSIAAAAISYQIIEKPILRLKNNFTSGKRIKAHANVIN